MPSEEVEAFMIAESAVAVRSLKLVKEPESWYTDWLTAMRLDAWNPLGDVPERIAGYLKESADERRLRFSNLLVEAIPETRRAPLVLFRILPTAVHLATAQAFGDSSRPRRFEPNRSKSSRRSPTARSATENCSPAARSAPHAETHSGTNSGSAKTD